MNKNYCFQKTRSRLSRKESSIIVRQAVYYNLCKNKDSIKDFETKCLLDAVGKFQIYEQRRKEGKKVEDEDVVDLLYKITSFERDLKNYKNKKIVKKDFEKMNLELEYISEIIHYLDEASNNCSILKKYFRDMCWHEFRPFVQTVNNLCSIFYKDNSYKDEVKILDRSNTVLERLEQVPLNQGGLPSHILSPLKELFFYAHSKVFYDCDTLLEDFEEEDVYENDIGIMNDLLRDEISDSQTRKSLEKMINLKEV